ncbi:protein GVQW3-like [Palaemon carinicauda]|uniref:protein GVQW3-like n=1 Tax=Palaemon carinicauda TaxID=392227 RepID=UPI0035B69BC2
MRGNIISSIMKNEDVGLLNIGKPTHFHVQPGVLSCIDLSIEWFNRFKSGRVSAESDPRSGRPQTARSAAVVERVQNLVMADRRSTVRETAQEVGLSKDSAHAILRDDLNMHRVAAKFVPRLLSPEQKDLRCQVVKDLLNTANTDPQFLNTVITGDESWVYGYDPETKRQSSQWKHPESPRPKKARQVPRK